MKRKIVPAGSSLAVTLPAEVVRAYGLKKGQDVDVAVHPLSGAVIVRPEPAHYEHGETTARFRKRVRALLSRRTGLYKNLAR